MRLQCQHNLSNGFAESAASGRAFQYEENPSKGPALPSAPICYKIFSLFFIFLLSRYDTGKGKQPEEPANPMNSMNPSTHVGPYVVPISLRISDKGLGG